MGSVKKSWVQEAVFQFSQGICRETLNPGDRILIIAGDLYGKVQWKRPYVDSRMGSVGKSWVREAIFWFLWELQGQVEFKRQYFDSRRGSVGTRWIQETVCWFSHGICYVKQMIFKSEKQWFSRNVWFSNQKSNGLSIHTDSSKCLIFKSEKQWFSRNVWFSY